MRTKGYIVWLLILVLGANCPNSSQARLFDKKSKKEKKHKKKHRKGDPAVSDSTVIANSGLEQEIVEAPKKKSKAELRKEKKDKKKKEKQEKKEKEKKERQEKKAAKKGHKPANVAPGQVPAQVVSRKWVDLDYPESTRKSRYRMDILAPIYLDELVRNGYVVKNIPEKAQSGLDFYKGVQIAVDTLKKAGYDIDIYVHDIASLLESTEMLLNNRVLDSADLIVEAESQNNIIRLADYCKRRKINFIFTGLCNYYIRDNQYVTVLQPSVATHCEWVSEKLTTHAGTRKPIMIVNRVNGVFKDETFKYFLADTGRQNPYSMVYCASVPDKSELAGLVDPAGNNTVVLPLNNPIIVDSILRFLGNAFPLAHFDIYGLPDWKNMKNLSKPGLYKNLSVNVTDATHFDRESEIGSYVKQVFKSQFGGEAHDMVYKGFETTFWYATMLKRHGTIFNKQYNDVETAPFTKFEVKPLWDEKGNFLYHENKAIFFTTYENGVMNIKK